MRRLLTYLRVFWRRLTRRLYRVPMSDPMHGVAVAFGQQCIGGYLLARAKQRASNQDLLENLGYAYRVGPWPGVRRTGAAARVRGRRYGRVLGRPIVYEFSNPAFDRRPRLFRGCGKAPGRLIKVGETEWRADYVPRAEQLSAKRGRVL